MGQDVQDTWGCTLARSVAMSGYSSMIWRTATLHLERLSDPPSMAELETVCFTDRCQTTLIRALRAECNSLWSQNLPYNHGLCQLMSASA